MHFIFLYKMGVLILFVKLLFIFNVVKSENNVTTCVNDFRNITNNERINITQQICNKIRCIAKCCPVGEIYLYTPRGYNCTTMNDVRKFTNRTEMVFDYKNITIYKAKSRDKSNLNLVDDYTFVRNNKIINNKCADNIKKFRMLYNITEESTVQLENPNTFRRWRQWKFDEFCMDYVVFSSPKGVKGPFPTFRLKYNSNNVIEHNSELEIYSAASMLVSLFFLILVLLVYGAIRELRNLVGIMLMAYVSTLALTFLFQAIHKLIQSKQSKFCKSYSAINYFLILSTFAWMNVMSLDIWWTFRGMFKSRPIHRRGELSKFLWYALYAWGVPLLVTIIVVVLDNSDLSDYPNIFKPQFEKCLAMMYEQPEIKYYMYMPCLALIILNWVFFLMTAFNIWRIRKNMSKFTNETTKYKNNQNRFGLYLKLAFVMGMSWVLEMIDELPRWLEKTAMFYNNLTGVAIFFIFVFKTKIFLMLCKRFSVKGKLVESMQRKYSNYSTTTASNSDRRQSNFELDSSVSMAPAPKIS